MKTTHKILLGLVAASAWLIAGSVTIPNSFTANTTAKASEVNANFSAVKTAVDGNADDITTNKSDISDNANDIATNKADITTNANNMITGVTATGGLTGGGSSGSVTVRRVDGNISISPVTFISSHDDECMMRRTSYDTYFHSSSTSSTCAAYAPLILPDGATLKSLTCIFFNNDSSTTTNPSVELSRQKHLTSVETRILFKVTSGNDSPGLQSVTDDTIDDASHATVDNGQYRYSLWYNPPNKTGTAGRSQRLYSCLIEYSYQ